MSSKERFYKILKKKVDQLQNEKQYQCFVEWNFKVTKKNVEELISKIKSSMESFYSYMDLLWEKDIPEELRECNFHFPGRTPKSLINNQEKYQLNSDNFLITLEESKVDDYISELNENSQSNILLLFLSPLSINYFHKSLYEIMLPLYTSQHSLPQDEEYLNNLEISISTSLSQNMCYFPVYLYALLSKVSFAKMVIRKFALNIFFLRPDIIGIEAPENKIKEVFQKLNYRFDAIAENFLFLITDQINQGKRFQYFNLLPDFDDENAFGQSTCINPKEYYLRQLLKISPKLPDKLPEYLENASYKEIIKQLVVRPGPQYLKRYQYFTKFAQMKIGDQDEYIRIINGMRSTHETEEIAKLSNISVHLSNIHKITSKVIDNCKKMCLRVLKVDNKKNDLTKYIKEPQMLIKNTQELGKNFFSDKKNIFSSIYSSDDFYKYLVKAINFDTFIEHRKDILTADRSLDIILESFKNHKFEITALYDLQKQNKYEFNYFRNLFVEAFSKSNDPYAKAKEISHVYTSIVRKVKYNGIDVDTMNEDERNTFILSVFCLFMPTKIISVYVFLTEFVFHSSYNEIFKNESFKNDLEEINLTKSILRSLINTCSNLRNLKGIASFCPNFKYQCVNLSNICQENVNLKVMHNDEECEKLAIMSNPDYSMGNKSYDELNVNDHNTKSLINYFQKMDSQKNIILRIYVDENKIYVCNVSFLINEKVDPLPEDRTELIKYIQEHSEKISSMKA